MVALDHMVTGVVMVPFDMQRGDDAAAPCLGCADFGEGMREP